MGSIPIRPIRGILLIYIKHFLSILQHKWFVLVAGLKVGKIPLWRLLIHDWTKFLPVEFIPYAKKFQGEVNDPLSWGIAWNHHKNHNPHHREYWTLYWTGDRTYYDGTLARINSFSGVLPMPETYIREMVADFMGASRAYTGSWDMTEWLERNLPQICNNLHPDTMTLFLDLLRERGYNSLIKEMTLQSALV